MLTDFFTLIERVYSTPSPRKLSRFATLPRGYKPPIIVKPPKPLADAQDRLRLGRKNK